MSRLKEFSDCIHDIEEKLANEFSTESLDDPNKLTANEIRAIWMTVLFGFVCFIAILIAFLAMLVEQLNLIWRQN